MRYDTPDPDGETRRERNARFGVDPGPEAEVPHEGFRWWRQFWELNQARAQGESGPAPLSYSEIMAWSQGTGQPTRPEDVKAFVAMDAQYRQTMSAEIQAYRERKDRSSNG